MNGMLASVANLAEARLVDSFNVDIIDLKQPALGALGSLAPQEVADIVSQLNTDRKISATIGDLPMQPDLLYAAVKAMSATGVDFVKIGFFPNGNWPACIAGLAELAKQGRHLIAVLFADTRPELSIIHALGQAGFRGVMLDTQDKTLGSLTQLFSLQECQDFVVQAKSVGLLSGLAGSLNIKDVPKLLPLQADYLGFRGALCHLHQRTAELDPKQIADIGQLLHGHQQPLMHEYMPRLVFENSQA